MFIGGLVLSGCAGTTYSSHFDCPYGQGLGCASLSKVNKMIDQGEVDFGEDIPKAKKKNIHLYYGPNRLSKIVSIDE